ncbi:hypothetical protein [Geodermatophilus ruber]|uniref:Uncharacterized protein n=1 Tax=Geodermatophilus ruber TaxID=504800 RepID=A0A1I4FB94_9ACTN|nr:hypothetical protein [Geodermatophilus ruber]SFL15198.1 hypothetical protein SAMN04488085_10770 [Geodermatophilus ruber]
MTVPLPPAPGSRPRDDVSPDPRRYRFQLSVRTVLSAALVASLPVPASATAVPRHTTCRLVVAGDRHLADVVGRLTASGVEVVEIRAWPRGLIHPG